MKEASQEIGDFADLVLYSNHSCIHHLFEFEVSQLQTEAAALCWGQQLDELLETVRKIVFMAEYESFKYDSYKTVVQEGRKLEQLLLKDGLIKRAVQLVLLNVERLSPKGGFHGLPYILENKLIEMADVILANAESEHLKKFLEIADSYVAAVLEYSEEHELDLSIDPIRQAIVEVEATTILSPKGAHLYA